MKIPLIGSVTAHSRSGEVRKSYADFRPLPAFYMSEHSVLGLCVNNIGEAIQLLCDKGFYVTKDAFGAEVEIDVPGQLVCIVSMLLEAGAYCSICDVIDSVYQG